MSFLSLIENNCTVSHPEKSFQANLGLVSMANYGRGGCETEAVLRSPEDDVPPSALAWPAREADSRVPGARLGAAFGGPEKATIPSHGMQLY